MRAEGHIPLKALERDINVIEILDKLMPAMRVKYQLKHFISNDPVTPLNYFKKVSIKCLF